MTNALFDAHRDDPEFGYRFLVDEARAEGQDMAERTAWRLCSANGWWSVFGKPRGRNGKKKRTPGPPAFDDLVQRRFTAPAPNVMWLIDITEHPTGEGKLYCCAIKDVYSNRIVGYSIDSRMTAQLAITALNNAVTRRATAGADVAGCIVHADRGSQFRSRKSGPRTDPPQHGRIHGPGRPRPPTTPRWNRSSRCCRRTSSTGAAGAPANSSVSRSSPGSSAPTTAAAGKPARPIDPHRIRSNHDTNRHPGGLRATVTHSCSRPDRHGFTPTTNASSSGATADKQHRCVHLPATALTVAPPHQNCSTCHKRRIVTSRAGSTLRSACHGDVNDDGEVLLVWSAPDGFPAVGPIRGDHDLSRRDPGERPGDSPAAHPRQRSREHDRPAGVRRCFHYLGTALGTLGCRRHDAAGRGIVDNPVDAAAFPVAEPDDEPFTYSDTDLSAVGRARHGDCERRWR